MKYQIVTLFCLILLSIFLGAKAQAANSFEYRPNDRLLILAPHPDDEILATGGLIYGALQKRIPIKVVIMTCGDGYKRSLKKMQQLDLLNDHNDNGVLDYIDLGYLRCYESQLALKQLGMTDDILTFLGFPDGSLWRMFYSSGVVTSPYTKATQVPYSFAYFPKAYHSGSNLRDFIFEIIDQFQPSRIFTPTPTDSHGDHKVLHYLVQEYLQNTPELEHLEYLVHWEGVSPAWPYDENDFWPAPEKHIPPDLILSNYYLGFPSEKKKEILQSYHSQILIDSTYLNKFAKDEEVFWYARKSKQDYLQ